MISDRDLILEFIRGSKAAFENIVNRYHRPIFAYIYRLSNNKELTEDIVQECFLRVYKNIKLFNRKKSFRPWIYAIARNLYYDHCKKKGLSTFSYENLDYRGIKKEGDPLDLLKYQDERNEIIKALQSLDYKHREVLILRFYHNLKLKEIAAIVDIPLGTVKSRLFLALEKMKARLEEVDFCEEK